MMEEWKNGMVEEWKDDYLQCCYGIWEEKC